MGSYLCVAVLCWLFVRVRPQEQQQDAKVPMQLTGEDLLTAVGLAKYAYTKNAHNIPQLVSVAGVPQSLQRPQMVYERGVNGYMFRERGNGSRVFVAFRGTELLNVFDILEDIKWFGNTVHQYIPTRSISQSTLHQMVHKTNAPYPSFARSRTEDVWKILQGDWDATSLSYLVRAFEFVSEIKAFMLSHQIEDFEFVFVGHSLGGAIATLLAIALDAPAIVFNSPGVMTLATRACHQLSALLTPAASSRHHLSGPLLLRAVSRLCDVHPNNQNVFNVFFEADVIPQTIDFQAGQVCKIVLSDIAESIDSFSDDIRKIQLGGLLNVNFPEGMMSCEQFTSTSKISDFFQMTFLECFGAAHHVQVVYKILTGVPGITEVATNRCQPFFADADIDPQITEQKHETPARKLKRMFPVLIEEFESSAWSGGLGVLWRARMLANMFQSSTQLFRLIRHSPIILVVVLLPGWWARRVRRSRWRQRMLRDRISIILVTVDAPLVCVRILRESTLNQFFFGDQISIGLVHKAAQRTKPGRAILGDPITKEDYWMLKNPIVSSLYEQFGHGWLAVDMGLPAHTEWYYCAITAVKHPNKREVTDKIRVYLVREDTLRSLPDKDEINFRGSKSHEDAFAVLKEMESLLKSDEPKKENRGYKLHYQLRRIQLALPLTCTSHKRKTVNGCEVPDFLLNTAETAPLQQTSSTRSLVFEPYGVASTQQQLRKRNPQTVSPRGSSIRRIPSLASLSASDDERLGC